MSNDIGDVDVGALALAAAPLLGMVLPMGTINQAEADDSEPETLMADCQHCSVTFEQPADPTVWFRYCPYCGERVLPFFEEA